MVGDFRDMRARKIDTMLSDISIGWDLIWEFAARKNSNETHKNVLY